MGTAWIMWENQGNYTLYLVLPAIHRFGFLPFPSIHKCLCSTEFLVLFFKPTCQTIYMHIDEPRQMLSSIYFVMKSKSIIIMLPLLNFRHLFYNLQFGETQYDNEGAYAVLKPPDLEKPFFHSFKAVERPKVWGCQKSICSSCE